MRFFQQDRADRSAAFAGTFFTCRLADALTDPAQLAGSGCAGRSGHGAWLLDWPGARWLVVGNGAADPEGARSFLFQWRGGAASVGGFGAVPCPSPWLGSVAQIR